MLGEERQEAGVGGGVGRVDDLECRLDDLHLVLDEPSTRRTPMSVTRAARMSVSGRLLRLASLAPRIRLASARGSPERYCAWPSRTRRSARWASGRCSASAASRATW